MQYDPGCAQLPASAQQQNVNDGTATKAVPLIEMVYPRPVLPKWVQLPATTPARPALKGGPQVQPGPPCEIGWLTPRTSKDVVTA